MSLENIEGNLRDGYKQCQSGTMQHVDELMDERQTNHDLRDQSFYTDDGELYFLSHDGKDIDPEGRPHLAVTRESENLVLRHIDDAFRQLVNNHNYYPDEEEVREVLKSINNVVVDLTRLNLSDSNNEWHYLSIDTKKYGKKLNPEEHKLTDRIFGLRNMKMLSDAKISNTRIYVLNPEYVQKMAEKGPIGRVSWLGNFRSNSNFNAVDHGSNGNVRLRGVRRANAPAGRDAQNGQGPYRNAAKNPFTAHYDAILADPDSAVKAMDDDVASGLAGLVQNFLAAKKQ